MTTTIRLQREVFDAAAEAALVTRCRTDIGAVVTFTGVCRADENGEPIAALMLEHYPGMAEAEIARHVDDAYARWPLLGVTVIHRYGRIVPGEPIVLVVDCIEPPPSRVRRGRISHGLFENARAVLEAGRKADRRGVGRGQGGRRFRRRALDHAAPKPRSGKVSQAAKRQSKPSREAAK